METSTKSHNDFLQYKSMKSSTTFIMSSARNKFYTNLISENSCDHRKLFKVAKTLFNQKTELTFPHYQDSSVLANDVGTFFMQKIERVRSEIDATFNPTQSVETALTVSIPCFDSFESFSEENVRLLISKSSKKWSTLDPMPAPLVVGCLDVLLPVLTRMINLSLESGVFPENWKQADVCPRLKKSGLEVAFKNLSPYQ